MSTLRAVAVVSLALIAPIRASVAQGFARHPHPPAGFDIDSVADGGRYISMRNGMVWEVEISDRATTGSWEAGDFVGVNRIWAPRDGYDWQLRKSGNTDQLAAVKLVGRRQRERGY
jgi:hypothetical protein